MKAAILAIAMWPVVALGQQAGTSQLEYQHLPPYRTYHGVSIFLVVTIYNPAACKGLGINNGKDRCRQYWYRIPSCQGYADASSMKWAKFYIDHPEKLKCDQDAPKEPK